MVPRPKVVVFAAFQFDPEAAKDIDETKWPGVTLLKAQMNADLLTGDLKKKARQQRELLADRPARRNSGARSLRVRTRGKYRVSVLGFDYYNTQERCRGIGRPGQNCCLDARHRLRRSQRLSPVRSSFQWSAPRTAGRGLPKSLKAEIDEDLIEAYRGTVSLPFAPSEHRRIAVKIVDDRGIESLKVVEVGMMDSIGGISSDLKKAVWLKYQSLKVQINVIKPSKPKAVQRSEYRRYTEIPVSAKIFAEKIPRQSLISGRGITSGVAVEYPIWKGGPPRSTDFPNIGYVTRSILARQYPRFNRKCPVTPYD